MDQVNLNSTSAVTGARISSPDEEELRFVVELPLRGVPEGEVDFLSYIPLVHGSNT